MYVKWQSQLWLGSVSTKTNPQRRSLLKQTSSHDSKVSGQGIRAICVAAQRFLGTKSSSEAWEDDILDMRF